MESKIQGLVKEYNINPLKEKDFIRDINLILSKIHSEKIKKGQSNTNKTLGRPKGKKDKRKRSKTNYLLRGFKKIKGLRSINKRDGINLFNELTDEQKKHFINQIKQDIKPNEYNELKKKLWKRVYCNQMGCDTYEEAILKEWGRLKCL